MERNMAGRAERAFREDTPMESPDRGKDMLPDDERDRDWDRPRGRAPRRAGPEPYEDERMDEPRNGNGGQHPRHEAARERRPFPRPDPYEVGETYARALKRSADLVADQMQTFQVRTSRLINRRLDRDMDAMEAIARSRSLFELFGAQQKWLSGVASDYGDEMIRFGRLAANVLEEGVEATRTRNR
jgi:hypothetical protein